MPVIRVYIEELYPFFGVTDDPYDDEAEISEEDLVFVEKSMDNFYFAQEILRNALEEKRNKNDGV